MLIFVIKCWIPKLKTQQPNVPYYLQLCLVFYTLQKYFFCGQQNFCRVEKPGYYQNSTLCGGQYSGSSRAQQEKQLNRSSTLFRYAL